MTITNTGTAQPRLTASQIYDQLIPLADAGAYVGWATLAGDLRAQARSMIHDQRQKLIDRAADCDARATRQLYRNRDGVCQQFEPVGPGWEQIIPVLAGAL